MEPSFIEKLVSKNNHQQNHNDCTMTSHFPLKLKNDYKMTSHCVVIFPLKWKNDYQMTSHFSVRALLLLFAFVDKLFYQP